METKTPKRKKRSRTEETETRKPNEKKDPPKKPKGEEEEEEDPPKKPKGEDADAEAYQRRRELTQQFSQADEGEINSLLSRGSKPAAQCKDNKFGLNFCSEWCNTDGKWGCGPGTLAKEDGRNTGKKDYTCSCDGCNGCGEANEAPDEGENAVVDPSAVKVEGDPANVKADIAGELGIGAGAEGPADGDGLVPADAMASPEAVNSSGGSEEPDESDEDTENETAAVASGGGGGEEEEAGDSKKSGKKVDYIPIVVGFVCIAGLLGAASMMGGEPKPENDEDGDGDHNMQQDDDDPDRR